MKRQHIIPIVVVLLLSAWPRGRAQAISGIPGSLELGYAVRVDADSPQAVESITAVASLGIDWVILDVHWDALNHTPQGAYDLQALEQLSSQVEALGMHAVVSLSDAPDWAMTPDGPRPAAAAELVRQIATLAPDTLLALEVFPMPNTLQGWGASPNPQAYVNLLQSMHTVLQEEASPMYLIVGGLLPLPQTHTSEDIAATTFLKALYETGVQQYADIIGLAYPALNPAADTPENAKSVLRAYSTLRLIMLQYGHQNGTLWITRLTWQPQQPASSVQNWVQSVYELFHNQVYIGLVAFDGANASPERAVFLLGEDGNFTPVADILGQTLAPFRNTGEATYYFYATGAPHQPETFLHLRHTKKLRKKR
ncbi:MAG: hypothetical protein D6755_12240 [Anaerolineae bacterium]|nr:MAG: hypothetical protein D6755_12240 [Anaerolineae bacterium]